MPTVFSSLGGHPHLIDLEAIAMNFHSDGRNYTRHPRGDRGGNEVDTFLTRIEGYHRDLPEAHLPAGSGGHNRKTPSAHLHSKDVNNQLMQIMLNSAGYDSIPTLPSDVEAYTATMAQTQLIINETENLGHSDLSKFFKDPVLGASLAVDSNSTNSWEYTYPFQQIALGYMKPPTAEFFDVTVEREVTIGQRPSKVHSFSETMAEAKSISDSKSGPSAVAFKVLYTMVYKSDFADIAAKRCDHQDDTYIIPIPDPQSAQEDGRELQLFPTKVIFGAGNEWMGSLRVGISRCPDNPDTHYLIDLGASCQLELDFFNYLGLIVGFDPISDIAILSQFFRSFYPRDTFKPPLVIELATLAVAAGYKLESVSPTMLCLHVTGAVFEDSPVKLPATEHILPLDLLPKERIEFAKWTLYQTSAVYSILMGSLIRHLFPDVDITSEMLGLEPKFAYTWISELISQALSNSQRHTPTAMKARSRQELMLSVRKVINDNGGECLAKHPTRDVMCLAEMIPSWPSIVHGGARYLHPVRSSFFSQYETLKLMETVESYITPNLHRVIDSDLRLRMLYGRDLRIADSGDPTTSYGLLSHPDFNRSITAIDHENPYQSSENPKSIFGSRTTDQSWTNTMIEWGRLNPTSIPTLFQEVKNASINQDSKWLKHPRTYEGLRMISLRLFNTKDTIPLIENLLMQKQERTHQQELSSLSSKIRRQEMRVARFEQMASKTDRDQRIAIHNSVYKQIPGDNYDRNKKWQEKRKKRESVLRNRWKGDYLGLQGRKDARKRNIITDTLNHHNRQDEPEEPFVKVDLRKLIDRVKIAQQAYVEQTSRSNNSCHVIEEHCRNIDSAPTALHDSWQDQVSSPDPAPASSWGSAREKEHWISINKMRKPVHNHQAAQNKWKRKGKANHKRKVTLGPARLENKQVSFRHPVLSKKLNKRLKRKKD